MSFLAPLFLVGLVGLAVPVLVHLTRQERGKPVHFPSLMFLERIPFQEKSRRRIRHWLLLAVRAAAVALLVLAFARPFVRGGRLATVGGPGPEEVVILLDQSYSMGLADHWEQAVAQARTVADGLGVADRLSLVAFAESPSLLHRSLTNPSAVGPTLDTLAPLSLATRIAPALRLATSVLAASTLPRQRVVVISDFQRTGWVPDEDAVLPEGVVVEPLVIGADSVEVANLLLSGLELRREYAGARDRVTVHARLGNTGAAETTTEAVLFVDESEVGRVALTVPAGGAVPVSFAPFTLTDPFTQGEVRVEDEGLQDDNVLNFVASPGGDLAVLIVDPNGVDESNLYLRGALGIAEGAGFTTRVVRETPSASEIASVDVVIVNGGAFPGGEAGTRLRDFVNEGGGLLLALGERSRVPALHADFLPVTPGTVSDALNEPLRLGFVDYDHAIFEVFRGARSGDFSRAAFYRTYTTTVTGGLVLARFDDGSAALVEGRPGRGRVLVWTSGLDRLWSNLPLQPVFLPFVHQVVRHLAGREELPSWHLAGSTVNLAELAEARAVQIHKEAVAMSPDGGAVHFDSAKPLLRLDAQGLWEIRPPGERPAHPLALAANVALAESDLTKVNVAEFAAAVGGGAGGGADLDAGDAGPGDSRELAGLGLSQSQEAQDREIESRQSFWRYLLLAVFLLLASETVLANRLSRE